MGVSLLATLDEAYQRRVLEVDAAVLADVYCALVRAKVCVKPKKSAPAAALEGLRGLFVSLAAERDAAKIERKLVAMVRVISGCTENVWFDRGKPTRIAILWLITCMAFARLGQLDAIAKPSSTLTAAAAQVFKTLADTGHLPDCDDEDHLQVLAFVKALVVCLLSSVPTRDKTTSLSVFRSLQLHVEDVLVPLNTSSPGAKTTSVAIDFCREAIINAPLPDAFQAIVFALQKCFTVPDWHRVFNDLVSGRPYLAALLVEDIDTAFECKASDACFRRLVLSNLVTALMAVNSVETTSVDRLLCTALYDQDVVLRALAWKALTRISSKVDSSARNRLTLLGCESLFVESSRSVGAAILKFFVEQHRLPSSTNSSIDSDFAVARRVQDFLLLLMSQRGMQFPSSWIQDAKHLLTQDRLGYQYEVVLKCFSTGTKEGQQLVACAYREHLISLGDMDAHRELLGLARGVGLDTVTSFERLIDFICNDLPTDEQTNSKRESRAAFLLPISSFDESCVSTHELSASILLESAILRVSTDVSSRLEALFEASSRMLQAVSIMMVNGDANDRCELEAFTALRGLRVAVELDPDGRSRYVVAVESALQSNLATLVMYPALQRETVKLLYVLPRPQEKVYWCLALSQEDAFTDITKLTSFIALLGVIASENAQHVTQQQLMRKPDTLSQEFDEDEEQQKEGTNYMDQFKNSLELKNRIKSAKEASISDSLLSAYLPLIEKALDTSHVIQTKVAAMWTLGEFMKISTAVTEVYFSKLLSITLNGKEATAITKACIDVWHSLQPTMKPSRTKERGVEVFYQLIISVEKDAEVVMHALKCLQHLVLHAQLRDDRLHIFSSFLLSPNREAVEITQRFFRNYFRQHSPAKASSTIFEIYFALVGDLQTKATAKGVASRLIEIVSDGSDSLALLESALVDELDSAKRCMDALELLEHFNVLSVSTVQKLAGSIERFLSCPNNSHQCDLLEQMFVKQLQRTKVRDDTSVLLATSSEKAEKARLKEAILKLKGQRSSEDVAQCRRVPLNVVSIGRLVQSLRK